MYNHRVLQKVGRFGKGLTLKAGLAFLLAPACLAMAAGPGRLEKTLDTTESPQISLTNLRGQVTIRGWVRNQVHVICVTVSPRVEVDIDPMPRTGRAERLQLATHVLDPMLTGNEETADCSLEVPAGSSLEIRNRQGSVQIEKLQGLHTWIESADGKITAMDVASHLTVRSLGGDIELMRPTGRTEAYSITGNIQILDPESKNLRANTNSGRVTYRGDFMPTGEYVLSTYSGDIEVLCPSSASFELNAKTVKGKLENTFALTPKRHASTPFSSANSLFGTHNTGNATVELTSFSGRIRVRPQP
ncbi:MAG: DUF4097 domain-containing protein [Terriglobia bacterium]